MTACYPVVVVGIEEAASDTPNGTSPPSTPSCLGPGFIHSEDLVLTS